MKEILNLKPKAKEVKKLFKKIKELNKQINDLPTRLNTLNENIKTASEFVVEDIVKRTLECIDIDEINRGELSLRLSGLKQKGYTNYLKIYKQNDISKLFRINGISQYSAYQIKRKVHNTADELRKNTHPTFNLENKNKNATILLSLLYIQIHAEPLISTIKNLYNKFNNEIEKCMTKCNVLTNDIKWIFASQNNKINAIKTHIYLKELTENNYISTIEFALSQINTLSDVQATKVWKEYSENSARYYAHLEKTLNAKINQFKTNGLSNELAETINNLDIDLTGLKCTLRSYQEFGVKYILHQQNVLLGDEMGLGKTVQAIGAMVALNNLNEKYFIVVCPASVLINWCREIKLHSNLTPHKIHGEDRELNLETWLQNGGIAVTTYETLSKLNIDKLNNVSMLIVDEAHYIKNPKALRTINLLKVRKKSNRVLFMTGTPLENNVDEMHFLIKNLQPDIAKLIENMKQLSSAKIFKEKISPVYFRRTREEVLKELPDLIENEEWCEMTASEKEEYKSSTQSENFMAMRQVSWQTNDITKSSKGQRLLEIYERAVEEKRKIIVFSFFLNTLQKVQELLGDKCVGCITGSIAPSKRQEIVDKFTKSKEGSVLVSQIQAGGTGLNIQTASIVVICEPQLKPSIENQAISRTYRMGQVRDVIVYRLLCEDSVDERILELLENKQNIFDNFADKSLMGNHSLEITEQTTKRIIEKEKELQKKKKILKLLLHSLC